MRRGSYGLLIDLLRASTKGINPLKLTCVGYQEDHVGHSTPSMNSPKHETTLLPAFDPATLSGGRKLNQWFRDHSTSMHQAMNMLSLDLYGMDEIRPAGALFKVLEW